MMHAILKIIIDIALVLGAGFVWYLLYIFRVKWLDKIWNWMYRVKADKFWHYIGFREYTAYLLRQPHWTLKAIIVWVVLLAIAKELIDWWKGEGVDFGDLLADVLGITMAFIN